MPASIAFVSTPTQYNDTCTLELNEQAREVGFVISNNSAIFQLGRRDQNGKPYWDQSELTMTPTTGGYEDVTGIRFRSADPANPAVIVAAMYFKGDPKPQGFTPFTQNLTVTGHVSTSLNIGTIALASFPPSSPADGDTYWLILPSSYDPVGGKSIRWLVVYNAGEAVWDVAGADLEAEIDTQETESSGVYVDLATVGPTITIPRPGDYDIWCAVDSGPSGGGILTYMSYAIGANAAQDSDAAVSQYAFPFSVAKGPRRKNISVAGTTIVAKYRGGSPGTFARRRLAARPVRIT